MKINLNLSPLANVLGLLNLKNGSNINETHVFAGPAIETTENPGDNTKITLTGNPAHGYKDSMTYYYGRYNLLGGKEPDPGSVAIETSDTQDTIRTKITTAFGLMPSELVINNNSDITIPSVGNEIVTVNMTSKEGSLLYAPDTQPVKITANGVLIPVALAFGDTTIKGMDGYVVDATKFYTIVAREMVCKQRPIFLPDVTRTSFASGVTPYTPVAPDTSNTKATFIVSTGGRFVNGSIDVYYTRATWQSQKVPTPAYVEVTAGDTGTTVGNKIMTALNLARASTTITNIVMPTQGVDTVVDVSIPAGNPLYLPDAFTVTLRLAP